MPLRGVRVVTIAQNVPGPVAAAMLRDRGAEVVKIEPPSGDPLAAATPDWYGDLHRGIEVHRVDLKTATGRARLEGWLEAADLLLASSRPAALERLGVGWAALHSRHPRLCMVSIVGYPAPRQDAPGHDLTYQAEHGLVRPPLMPASLVADLGGAQAAMIAAVSLLFDRERGNGTGLAEVALAESARFFGQPIARGMTTASGWLGGARPEYNVYRTSDGWIAVAALEPHFRDRLARELGLDLRDPAAVASAFSTKTSEAWQRWADAHDLPIVPVRVP